MKYTSKFKNVFDRSSWADKKMRNFKRIDKNYIRLFNLDFFHEIQFINSKKLITDRPDKIKEEKDTSTELNVSIEEYKKIYRNLARLTHPDTPYGETEEFKKIRQAYVDGDVGTLLSEAIDRGLEPEISEEDIERINKVTDGKVRKMRELRQGYHFRWAASARCLKERKRIWSLLSIDSSEFKAFLADKNIDLRKYHKESLDRWGMFNKGE